MFWRQKHPVSEEQLSAYTDGRVSAAERESLEAHLGGCTPCRETLAELNALSRVLTDMPKAVRPRSFALREADVEAVAGARVGAGGLTAAMPMLSGVAMASFVAFMVLVGVDMNDAGSSDDGTGTTPGAYLAGPPPNAESDAFTSATAASADDGDAEDASQGVTRSPGAPAPSGTEALLVTATVNAVEFNADEFAPSATPPEPKAQSSSGGDDSGAALKLAQIATLVVGLVAASSMATLWWRRRA